MNTREYILSGIVESYVMDLADKAERREFEQMCLTHPEVREARDAFELSLEEHARRNSAVLPPSLKSRIFSALREEASRTDRLATPVAPVKRMRTGRYAAAASVILLAGSVGLNIYQFSKNQSITARNEQLLAERTQLAHNNDAVQTHLQHMEQTISMLKDTSMAVIPMPGTNVPSSPDPSSMATIYWDRQSKDVFLLVNNMPVPAANQQYQLWAIVDGAPVDAGVFDVNAGDAMIKMKNIPKAQAFAVTLEKKGGSETPTIEKMYILGKVV